MNCLMKLIIGIFLCTLHASIVATSPFIYTRSQSVDAARDLVGVTDKYYLFDMENLYLVPSIVLEGTRSWGGDAIGHCMFGLRHSPLASDSVSVNVTGSQVPDRSPTDWLADYFGLSTTFQSTLFFHPRVSNIIVDFSFYVGLDEFVPNLYFWIQAPVVATRWDLNFTEIPNVTSALPLLGYDAGYFAPAAVPVANLLTSATEFFSDADVPTLNGGVVFEPLAFARLEQTRQSKTGLAEIQMALGYNFISCPDYYLGLNFRVYAPTGNRPKGIFAFEPIVGNGKHWEVGVGFTSGYVFWRSCDEETEVGFYCVGNFTHMCSTHQTRTFDLVGLPVSRYMLAEKLGTPVVNLFANPAQGTALGSTVPAAQFQGVYTPVANLTTVSVNSSFPIQVDIVALFNYTSCGLSFDIGYDFWATSTEKLSLREKSGPTALASGNVWALKGDARVFGFVAADAVPTAPLAPGDPVALSATENTATIHAGTNTPIGTPFNPTQNQNPGVDNAQFAMFDTMNNTQQLVVAPGDNGGPTTQQRTSNDPIFLSNANIDLRGGRTRGISNKIFVHLSYTWQECDDVMPYLGIGGKAEFGPRHGEGPCAAGTVSGCPIGSGASAGCIDCKSGKACNLSEWGIWIKGGLFFS